ncbi:hypothetical protein BS50DRAFT_503958 [Corynespora cassiicola Philippines]|uniref:Uncharacterized protein n=1 Tax=Corynespora cassiicola Philippines TaxID=1448308 RepID=A0A2T2N8S4_CORCC|nr:hypothetical protein BS50DRAFT_503958 [Corynespora cassiicola Philippines]
MASRYDRSPYSSRSVSPETRYDPFEPTAPLEMSNMAQSRSPRGEYQRVAPSTESTPRPGSYPFSHTQGNQYASLHSRDLSNGTTANNSAAASMFSTYSLNHYKTMDAATQALVDKRAGELAQWHIHWTTPAMMAGLYIAGILGALGHHFFYQHLDGRPAEAQLTKIRYGTALAFFVKSTLVGTVVLCYRQRIWRTFRRKAMTINAIDGLFAATEDLTAFWNWEMICNGKLATFMALCSWLIPIASVLSPASLTSEISTIYNHTECPVATLNFTHEALFNFRKAELYPGYPMSYYNTTDMEGKEGYFDYYDQPSKNARRLAVTSAYLKKPVTHPNASINSCEGSWNCTYSITFTGPGYKCEEIASSNHPDPKEPMPITLNTMAPEGDHLYYAEVDMNDYVRPQADVLPGQGVAAPGYPDSTGVFESEPDLWLGYSIKTTQAYDNSSRFASKWGNVHESKIVKCVLHHTNYTFAINYTDTVQYAHISSRTFLDPLIQTTLTRNEANTSAYTASPASAFVRPKEAPETYKLTASYHALGALLRNFLRGRISYTKIPNGEAPIYITESDISETKLMEQSTSYVLPDLQAGVQALFEDMLLSLLSEEHFVVTTFAPTPCTKSRAVNVFVYHKEGLWVGYAIAVAATAVFLVVGYWSIHQNGVASDTQFSRIMVTTRNPTLDRLAVGACLGGDPFPRELRETKLRFGVLLEEDPREGPLGRVEHCCFGAAGETKDIVKKGLYAGLRRYLQSGEEEGAGDEKRGLLEGME